MHYDETYSAGWDCDPTAILDLDDDCIDEEDAYGDWQSIACDRWGDRLIQGDY